MIYLTKSNTPEQNFNLMVGEKPVRVTESAWESQLEYDKQIFKPRILAALCGLISSMAFAIFAILSRSFLMGGVATLTFVASGLYAYRLKVQVQVYDRMLNREIEQLETIYDDVRKFIASETEEKNKLLKGDFARLSSGMGFGENNFMPTFNSEYACHIRNGSLKDLKDKVKAVMVPSSDRPRISDQKWQEFLSTCTEYLESKKLIQELRQTYVWA